MLRRRARLSGRGFTLVELVAVVVIIGITAALATPSIAGQIRERRARDAAQRIALLYSSARMRALGRGSAVRVSYSKLTGFTVLESVEGVTAATALDPSRADCASQPGLGCLANDWKNPDTYRPIAALGPVTDVKVTVKDGNVAKDNMDICFTPMGRSFRSFDGEAPRDTMTTPTRIEVQRQRGGVNEGLLRTVALLPNGIARLGR